MWSLVFFSTIHDYTLTQSPIANFGVGNKQKKYQSTNDSYIIERSVVFQQTSLKINNRLGKKGKI